ncbi:hypothetical protein AVEN_29319-1 [Araneus ventricosus]|uniref:Uncharacterized protein n=1 Tax=Araneus ventricosus TaxID=182803 RepID=A0A4Y2IXI6_ARAVE|nr:hypothetical protein AVEN_29319-1 [Araneus ventricosus]
MPLNLRTNENILYKKCGNKLSASWTTESEDQREHRLQKRREQASTSRAAESEEQREHHLQTKRIKLTHRGQLNQRTNENIVFKQNGLRLGHRGHLKGIPTYVSKAFITILGKTIVNI